MPPAPAAISPAAAAKTLEAFIEALQWNLASADAGAELLDYASAAPDIAALGGPVRGPFGVRPGLLRQLLTLSRGRDRLGRLLAPAGERLRAKLLTLASSQGGTASPHRLARLT